MTPPLFILSRPAFTIPGKGLAVLSGISTEQACPFKIGDRLVCHAPWVAHRTKIHSIEQARINAADEQYALVLSLIDSEDLPQGARVYDYQSVAAHRALDAPFVWTGDLDDDCSAHWAELILRAEEMDENTWWWAVTDHRLFGAEIGSSNWQDHPCVSGKHARQQAEQCAINYLTQDSPHLRP